MAKKQRKPRGEQKVVTLDYLVRKAAETDKEIAAVVALQPDAGKVYKPTTREIPLAKLRVDRTYQRLTNKPLVKKIIKKFTENAGMMILVSRRKSDSNDVYYIIEGQQRATSLFARGYKAAHCIVVNMDDIIAEAKCFININKERRAVSPAKQFLVELLAIESANADEVTDAEKKKVELNTIIESADYEIFERDGRCRIIAPVKMQKIRDTYERDLDSVLKWALVAYREIWPDHDKVHATIVGALACLYYAVHKRHRCDARNISTGKLRRLVASEMRFPKVKDLLEKGREAHAHRAKGALGDAMYANIILGAYNREARAQDLPKLPQNLLFKSGNRLQDYLEDAIHANGNDR